MRGITGKRQLFTGLATGLFVAIAVVLPVFAADGTTVESITLSPVNKHYELRAGETKTDELTIINDGKVAYDFIVYAKPYSVTSENYDPDFSTQATNADAYRWVEFGTVKYRLQAGESTKVPYTITVPANATPGGHYGVLFAETQPQNTTGGNAVVRKKRVGSILYATVKGTYETGGQFGGANIPFLQLQAPLKVTTTTSNTGNTDFINSVSVKVTDLFGNLKYETEKDYAVLPQTSRKMSLEWTTAPMFGLYKVEVTSSFLDQKHSPSQFVLMVPGWALGVLGFVIVGGIIYLALRRRY